MKILITGAGGMLGTDLVLRLAAKHDVVGSGRRPAPHLNITFHQGNLANMKTTFDLVKAEKPEVILHAASMTEVDRCESERRAALLDNFEATRNVVDAGNRAGAFIIHFGTDFVFDGTKPSPYREDDIPHPISVYGETKLLGERYVLLRAKRFVIVRSSWLFGKQGDDFPKKIIRQAEAGKQIRVVADQFGNPTYTRDLAGAVGQLLEEVLSSGSGREKQIYHITNDGTLSRYEFARMVLRKKHLSSELVSPISSEEGQFPARRPQNSALSNERVKQRFGIQLRPLEEALDAYLQELVSPSLSL